MKILVLSGYANGHFISQKLLENNSVKEVHHTPSVFQPTGRYLPANISLDDKSLVNYTINIKPDLAILTNIGTLRDSLLQESLIKNNIPKFGPNIEYSNLEWSKLAGKRLLNQLGIPTANHKMLAQNELLDCYHDIPRPWVLKYEKEWRAGLQTIIINDSNYIEEFETLKTYGLNRFIDDDMKLSNQKLEFLVEDFIDIKREYSYHIVANQKGWVYLGSARDYKKFNDGDKGFNTASMGCYSPVDINLRVHDYADKIINHLMKTDPYTGILYLGIAEDHDGNPYVLEINTRAGDPELQSIILTHDSTSSLVDILYQTATGQTIDPIKFSDKSAVSVRVVRKNYRDVVNNFAVGNLKAIGRYIDPDFYPEVPGIYIAMGNNRGLLHSVMTTQGNTRQEASDKIYKFLSNKNLYSFTYRTDIGYLE